jgi:transposase InsO family protein
MPVRPDSDRCPNSSDAPKRLAHVFEVSCPACTEANATHLSHKGSRYTPSYPGSLIHGDTVGPFQRSSRGHHYALILVDDHSRFKFILPLTRKSDAPAMMRKFVADFNRKTGQVAGQPTRRVGAFHSDNAGEFVSREFREFLDSSLISQSTSPPHVHDLNGVAERAIRSCMEGVRSDIAASKCPISFWETTHSNTPPTSSTARRAHQTAPTSHATRR